MKDKITLFIIISFLSCSTNNDKIRIEIRECLKSKYKEINPNINLYNAYLILEEKLIDNKLLINSTTEAYVHFIDSVILPKKRINIDVLLDIKNEYSTEEIANLNSPASLNCLFCFIENKDNFIIKDDKSYRYYIKNLEFLLESSSNKEYFEQLKKIIESTPKNQFNHIEYRAPIINGIFGYLYSDLDFEKV